MLKELAHIYVAQYGDQQYVKLWVTFKSSHSETKIEEDSYD